MHASTRDREEEEPALLTFASLSSPSLTKETVLVFDWDDTILPTSWLERIHALTGGPLKPEVQRQIAGLCVVAAQTLTFAMTLGTVIIITNSAPGWVDQSCQLFMPQILQQVRLYPIFAKPMHAPLTFKINAFRKECRNYRNLISVGDGDAERVASLRLQASGPPDGRGGRLGEGNEPPKKVKSVKLIDLPTCQQLIQEHEMLQVRLADVVAYQGSLDLKSRFPVHGHGSPGSPTAAAAGKAGGCTLVHFSRPQVAAPMQAALMPARAPSAAAPSQQLIEDGATSAGGRMQASLRSLPPHRGQLPPLGGRPLPLDVDAIGGGRSRAGTDGGFAGLGSQGGAGGAASGAPTAADERGGGEGGGDPGDRAAQAAEAPAADVTVAPDAGGEMLVATSPSRSSPGSLWKVQGVGERERAMSTGRPLYGSPGKKRSMMVPGFAARGAGAVWREQSAPAGARGF